MDPISAAGIGLSVASLALQIFAGCVKAYQLFGEAESMPASYQYLRVRLRLEQTRLLRWGEKIGLIEELLDKPSRTLKLNRNLVFDILLEIQALFKNTVKIQDNYDRLVPDEPVEEDIGRLGLEDRLLRKTLKVLNKMPQAPRRLQWALIKADEFQALIEKLIGYNDALEGLLEAGAMEELLDLQRQTYMGILQLNNKVDNLRELSLAMQVQTVTPVRGAIQGAEETGMFTERQKENDSLANLASFKAQQTVIETQPSLEGPTAASEIVLLDNNDADSRCEATFRNENVWIEWKEYDADNENPRWAAAIAQRVQTLVTLLKSPQKSPLFRSPNCLGYFLDTSLEYQRFGLIYAKPPDVPPTTPPTSLLSQILTKPRPSLTRRLMLARSLALSLMYLHSVNWLHKGLRSSNVVFFLSGSASYASPIISGFEYARLNLVEELTEPVAEHSENDLYRHPAILNSTHARSKKSHDIYSLGIVLVEIAHWKSISSIIDLPKEERAARKAVRRIRELVLGKEYMDELKGLVGDSYADSVGSCLQGLVAPNEDEENLQVGAKIQRAFKNEVVDRLEGMKV